jgi:DMSO/TMAO reductase YedYZ molybdopterin-dependent catalytic subunit
MTIRSRESAHVEVTGVVAEPRSWDHAALEALDTVDIATVVAEFTGSAVRIGDLLDASEPLGTADHCTIESGDGLYRASIPLADLSESAWLVFSSEGGPLPRDRGGPFRLVVQDGRTLCWNVKGVAEVRVTMGREPDSIPENPPH